MYFENVRVLYSENGWSALDKSRLCLDCFELHFVYVCQLCNESTKGCAYNSYIVAPYDRCECATKEGN